MGRRRALAAPFVLTVAASVACTPAKQPETQTPVDARGGAADPDAGPPAGNILMNPDGTCSEIIDVTCPEGTMCNPPLPRAVPCPPELALAGGGDALPPAPTGAKGSLERGEDGTCTFYFDDDCAPGDQCNPPPPMRVRCPSEQPSGASSGAQAGATTSATPSVPTRVGFFWHNKDRTCSFSPRMTDCPEGAVCNPPSPMLLDCPRGAPERADVQITREQDGFCWLTDMTSCPPQAACKPPPRSRLECPPWMPVKADE
ncbi:MAG: hypothetical protein H6713_11615 [Myxococcales bacterium]|nr:hypothetical protein [Myxococcales bacterium]MCB9750622.1 hypothetical protein [Myxococcales bacterium]